MAGAVDDQATRRAANRELLDHVLSLFGTDRAGELVSCYTPDWVLELPFADPPVRLEGGQEIGTYLASRLGTFVFTLSLTAVHECLDPDLLVVEYESDGHVSHTGQPYRNTYIALWRFRDGRVCGVKEFPNPMVTAEALAPLASFDATTDDLPGDDEG
ncbi:MAG: nuclear transport factor 2 family protein [Acidimicrobiales bacterium]|nr:nuclear transport factor 2 family protein [Acidimicrobiales bacterium]